MQCLAYFVRFHSVEGAGDEESSFDAVDDNDPRTHDGIHFLKVSISLAGNFVEEYKFPHSFVADMACPCQGGEEETERKFKNLNLGVRVCCIWGPCKWSIRSSAQWLACSPVLARSAPLISIIPMLCR